MESEETADGGASRRSSALRRDFQRHYGERRLSWLRKLQLFLDTPGLHAVIVYRFGSWVGDHVRFKLLRYPLLLLHYVLQKLCIICWGIFIDSGAKIGPGLYIGHFGGIIVGPIKMGRDCNINHQVTIGVRADGAPGVPEFGDRVWIGAGAIIYGSISVGDGVSIGPGTVVSRSLPPRVMVAGNPMRVLFKEHDNTHAIYGSTPPSVTASPAITDPIAPDRFLVAQDPGQ